VRVGWKSNEGGKGEQGERGEGRDKRQGIEGVGTEGTGIYDAGMGGMGGCGGLTYPNCEPDNGPQDDPQDPQGRQRRRGRLDWGRLAGAHNASVPYARAGDEVQSLVVHGQDESERLGVDVLQGFVDLPTHTGRVAVDGQLQVAVVIARGQVAVPRNGPGGVGRQETRVQERGFDIQHLAFLVHSELIGDSKPDRCGHLRCDLGELRRC
jgi:hypothetical protein